MFSCREMHTIVEIPQLKIISLKPYKQRYIIHTLSDNDFYDTVVNQEFSSLYGGSLEITLTSFRMACYFSMQMIIKKLPFNVILIAYVHS